MKRVSRPRPPVELLELASAYQRSQTLAALVALDVPTRLAKRPLSLGALARSLGVHPLAADRFINACVALGMLERSGDRIKNSPLAERFLIRGRPDYLGGQILNLSRGSYARWADLATHLLEWRPGRRGDPRWRAPAADVESLRLQHNLSLMVGAALASSFDFSRHRNMLDLGGGTGSMSLAICEVHPRLRSLVFELPECADLASRTLRKSGMSDRIGVQTGDFLVDPLPSGFDLVLLSNVLSVTSEEAERALLARVYQALLPGGALLLTGWILDEERTRPLLPVLFCLEDINCGSFDVERSAGTYRRWLSDAGFRAIQHRKFCPPWSLVIGGKPRRKVGQRLASSRGA